MTSLGPGTEFDLIRRFLARDADARLPYDVLVGPGDDATVVAAHPLAISTDLSIEGVHFRRDWLEPEEIGWRAATAGLSDLAAMVSRPVGVLISIAVSEADARDIAARVVAGATDAARSVDARLLGGDLTRSPGPLMLDVVVLGEVSQPLRRDGARPADEVWVTGRLGAPAMAVRDWLGGRRPADVARARFARPVARTREALWLRERADLTAGIDLSDGLAGDVPHLAAASGVTIVVDRAALPVHEAAESMPELALTGGEEYELCLVAPAGSIEFVVDEFEAEFRLPLTRIGVVSEADGAGAVWLRNQDGSTEPMPTPSYRHFDQEGRTP
jgi:thiamine-monophosphate kinase